VVDYLKNGWRMTLRWALSLLDDLYLLLKVIDHTGTVTKLNRRLSVALISLTQWSRVFAVAIILNPRSALTVWFALPSPRHAKRCYPTIPQSSSDVLILRQAVSAETGTPECQISFRSTMAHPSQFQGQRARRRLVAGCAASVFTWILVCLVSL